MKKTLLFIGSAVLFMGASAISGAQNINQNQKLRMAEAAISQFYVDTVNESKLVEDAIKGMLEGLDPHSQYSNPEETRELNEPLAGNFSGIGISFNMDQDTLYVIQTVSGGPSERVGILAGDRIISVNDTVIAGVGMKNTQIMKRLRGPKGSEVDVKVLRRQEGKRDTIDFTITRADIPIYSVDAAYMVDPKTGYLRINRFAAETAHEVQTALKDLKAQGMDRLILDLVDNGGGYLNAAVDLLGGNPRIVLDLESMPRLLIVLHHHGQSGIRIHIHTAEFVYFKRLHVLSRSVLLKQNRTPVFKPDRYRSDQKHRSKSN